MFAAMLTTMIAVTVIAVTMIAMIAITFMITRKQLLANGIASAPFFRHVTSIECVSGAAINLLKAHPH